MFDEETAAAIRAERDAELAVSETCEVLAENWPALELWHECLGFVRHAPMGGISGIDWPQVSAFFSLTGDSRPADDWRAVRVIEAAFVKEINKA